jgi:hypothetical protein
MGLADEPRLAAGVVRTASRRVRGLRPAVDQRVARVPDAPLLYGYAFRQADIPLAVADRGPAPAAVLSARPRGSPAGCA